jgi:hypothetical protein
MTCATTAIIALFCSVVFQRTSISQMTAYLVILVLFGAPLAVHYYAETIGGGGPVSEGIRRCGLTSPISAAFAVPLAPDADWGGDQVTSPSRETAQSSHGRRGDWGLVAAYFSVAASLNVSLLGLMVWLFRKRWRVSQ